MRVMLLVAISALARSMPTLRIIVASNYCREVLTTSLLTAFYHDAAAGLMEMDSALLSWLERTRLGSRFMICAGVLTCIE